MSKFYISLLLLLNAVLVKAQFAPQAGLAGTTAIAADSNIFKAWASSCELKRGWQNIADTSLGQALVGDETYVIGEPGNGVVSLGDGGIATVAFNVTVKDGPGPDFAIFENGFKFNDTLAYLELAFVEVSSDGENFVRFPAQSFVQNQIQLQSFDVTDARHINNLAGKYIGLFGTPFDLFELKDSLRVNINSITHIRIIDVVGSLQQSYASYDVNNQAINDPWPTPFASSGFDLDAVGVINTGTLNIAKSEPKFEYAVYPNPVKVNEPFHITNNNHYNINIYSMLGQKILPQYSSGWIIDEAGWYIIEIKVDNAVYRKRLYVVE